MDYRNYVMQKVECVEAQYPTFLYAMPMSPTRVFFEVCLRVEVSHTFCLLLLQRFDVFFKVLLQETCLASKDAMPFDLLKKKLMSRLETMGVRVIKTYEEVII